MITLQSKSLAPTLPMFSLEKTQMTWSIWFHYQYSRSCQCTIRRRRCIWGFGTRLVGWSHWAQKVIVHCCNIFHYRSSMDIGISVDSNACYCENLTWLWFRHDPIPGPSVHGWGVSTALQRCHDWDNWSRKWYWIHSVSAEAISL